MSIYCHGCAALFYANQNLQELINELLEIRDFRKQPCFRTSQGPMDMGRSKERRVRRILKTLKSVGVEFGESDASR